MGKPNLAKLRVSRLKRDWDVEAQEFVPLPDRNHVNMLLRAAQLLLDAGSCNAGRTERDERYTRAADEVMDIATEWMQCLPVEQSDEKESGKKDEA